jgi:uncharacterized protein (DUF2147 family)
MIIFKRATVVRTNKILTAMTGQEIPAGTRLVLLMEAGTGEWKCKVQDPDNEKIRNLRVIITPEHIAPTFRGRPRKIVAS